MNGLIVGNPENRRIALFQAALMRQGMSPARVVDWASLSRNDFGRLRQALERCAWIRLESPGENEEVERRLVTDGLRICDATPAPVCLADDGLIAYQHGEILPNAAWYAGFSALLEKVRLAVEVTAPTTKWMVPPASVSMLFDKPRVHQVLAAGGVATTPGLGIVFSYEELLTLLTQRQASRVFLKPRYSSSASGVIALQRAKAKVLAITPVEMLPGTQGVRLFNSLQVRQYVDERQIAQLIDALGNSGLYVERWLPKTTWQGQAADLRVVVIAGQPRHTVLRMSRHPLTNLHLGNQRGDIAAFRQSLRPGQWADMLAMLREAARQFPTSLYFGADVLFTSRTHRPAIIELNAFGDLLPNVFDEGLDTYESEVQAWRMKGLIALE